MADEQLPEGAPPATAEAALWEPSEADKALAAEVDSLYDQWRQDRRPREPQWFINAAQVAGHHNSHWNDHYRRLERLETPNHRERLVINHTQAKFRARLAKFLKNRPAPIVVPASTDREDVLNARATQKGLAYQDRRLKLEERYKNAILWAFICGKSYWWFHWDPSVEARFRITGLDGQPATVNAEAGDVFVEVGSAFEVLVADPGLPTIGEQPQIMRCKMREVADLQARYPDKAHMIRAESTRSELFQYQRQVSQLGSQALGSISNNTADGPYKDGKGAATHVLVKEWFVAPNARFPKGRYVVTACGFVLRAQDELPYEFASNRGNPYPVVEFADQLSPGQFWPTTQIEHLIGIQREYNNIRSKIAEQLKFAMHPKLLYPKQAGIPDNSWTNEPGEKIPYYALPGLPPPTIVPAPNVAADAWRLLELLREEFDTLSNLPPAALGQASAGGESGFQTNLLQEAADSVHAPDIRQNELAYEEAMRKIRKLMALGYSVPRLISIVGRNFAPDVMEFSSSQIDENAEIIVYTGSALSQSPSVKTQQVMTLFDKGLLGDQMDPEVKRHALGMIDVGGLDGTQEMSRRDEDKARLENLSFQEGKPVPAPILFDNHNVHYATHTDEMKLPEWQTWPDDRKQASLEHLVLHAKYIDPMKAQMAALELGLPHMLPLLQPPMLPGQPPPGMPPPEGAPPAGPPQEGPPPPPQGPPPPQ